MTTGTSVPVSTPSRVASVTAMGRSSRIGRPQLPHLGRSVMRVRSTRLRVAQKGQATVARLPTSVTDTAHLPVIIYISTMASASISTSISGATRRLTATSVVAGLLPRLLGPVHEAVDRRQQLVHRFRRYEERGDPDARRHAPAVGGHHV